MDVGLPDDSIIRSTHEGDLPIPALPPAARKAHLFPDLGQGTCLVSIGQFCDAGCKAVFTASECVIYYKDTIILRGRRTKETNSLWILSIPTTQAVTPIPQSALQAVNSPSASAPDLVAFAHGSLWSPAITTLRMALSKGFLPPFPGLTLKTLAKYKPDPDATIQGHLDRARSNLRSTKTVVDDPFGDSLEETLTDLFPTQSPDNSRTHLCFAACLDIRAGAISSDLTGRFPVTSSNGNNYLLVVYDYDSNNILFEPTSDRKAPTLVRAYAKIHQRLVAGGCKPQLQRLDNECSNAFKAFLKAKNVEYQLVPVGDHRRNSAERAIRTGKNHLIAGWCSADDDFPLHLWDSTIEHAEIALNLLRGSRINPKLSAYEQLHGRFDFNRTPLAPPGTRVLAHVLPTNRSSWASHAIEGWYVGPAMEHYREHKVWCPSTNGFRTIQTLVWRPSKIRFPVAQPIDFLVAALTDIKKILDAPSHGTLVAHLQPSEVQKLRDLTDMFAPPIPPTPNEPPATVSVPPVHQPALSPPIASTDDTEWTLIQPRRRTQRVANSPNIPSDVAIITQPEEDSDDDASAVTIPVANPRRTKTVTPPPTTTPRRSPRDIAKRRYTTQRRSQRVSNTKKKTKKKQQLRAAATPRRSQRVPNSPKPPPPTGNIPNSPGDQLCAAVREAFTNTRSDLLCAAVRQAFEQANAPAPEPRPMPQGYAYKAVHPDTKELAEYPALLKSSDGEHWTNGMCNELGRLFQGYRDVAGTDTCHWIHPKHIPEGRKPTYVRPVVADRPKKKEPRRVRITVGGDRIDYPGPTTTKTSDLTTQKLLLNSVISTPNAKFCTFDIKDYFLGNPLPRKEYIRIPVHLVPTAIMEQYNLLPLVVNGFLYAEVSKGMYGLPQASRVANDFLLPRLAAAGYKETGTTPGLFKHETNSIVFCLTVDDFGVKYGNKADAYHLRDTLQRDYTITEDWEGTSYCGLDLKWNYKAGHVTISMDGYVIKALHRFNHTAPTRPQHAPYPWSNIQYGAKVQYAETDDSDPLEAAEIKRLQEIIGVFLFYARAIDNTMLTGLGSLAAAQSQGTQQTMDAAIHLLNYAATHPDAQIRYYASDMQLHIHSDASYLCEPKAKSRAAGFYFLGGKDNPDPNSPPPKLNGPVHILCKIIQTVVASAAESEFGGLFLNGQDGSVIRNTLEEMGHKQKGPTPMQTDNSTADGIANDTVKAKRSKAMDMRFYWIRDRVKQGQFRIHWKPGATNLADYHTKHHPPAHHINVRPTYIHTDQPGAS